MPLYDFSDLKIDKTISPRDTMIVPGREDQYFEIGQRALELIEFAANLCDKPHFPNILDFGCGTGLSGLALRGAGFTTLDGVDLSPEMLARARDRGLYRSLRQIAADDPLGVSPGDYAAIAAIGVIGAGAAPIAVFDRLMEALAPGGHLVLSFNDHALADRANEARLADWVSAGRARMALREYGPHLPARNLNSNVYVLERT